MSSTNSETAAKLPTYPVRHVRDADECGIGLRGQEAIIACGLLGWAFMKDRRGGASIRPPKAAAKAGWIKMNFDPTSVTIDLAKLDELPLYGDWYNGGSQWVNENCLSRGMPRWSEGQMLSLLFEQSAKAGFKLSIAMDGARYSVHVQSPKVEHRIVDTSFNHALVKAVAGVIVRSEPNFRFPIIPHSREWW